MENNNGHKEDVDGVHMNIAPTSYSRCHNGCRSLLFNLEVGINGSPAVNPVLEHLLRGEKIPPSPTSSFPYNIQVPTK